MIGATSELIWILVVVGEVLLFGLVVTALILGIRALRTYIKRKKSGRHNPPENQPPE